MSGSRAYAGLSDRYGDFVLSGRPERNERYGFQRVPLPDAPAPEPLVKEKKQTFDPVWSPPTRPISAKGGRTKPVALSSGVRRPLSATTAPFPARNSHLGTFGKFPPFMADPIDARIQAARERAMAQRALRGAVAWKPALGDFGYVLAKSTGATPAFEQRVTRSIVFHRPGTKYGGR